MDREYVLSLDTLAKLDNARVIARVAALERDCKLAWMFGFLPNAEAAACVDDVCKPAFYRGAPAGFRKAFTAGLREWVRHLESGSWRVQRATGEVVVPGCAADALVLSGYVAREVLLARQRWAFKDAGFDSPDGWLAAVGALAWNAKRGVDRRAYEWRSEHDGRRYRSCVYGSDHNDLRIDRTDVTPENSVDPVGHVLPLRPIAEGDRRWCAPYHSTEPSLLAGLLRYVRHNHIPSKLATSGGVTGFLAEHDMTGDALDFIIAGYDGDASHALMFLDHPLPRWGTGKDRMGQWLCTTNDSAYGMYVGAAGQLIIAYPKDDPASNTYVEFPPAEVDELAKSLLLQALHHRGRTPAKTLAGMLHAQFDPEVEKRRKRS